MNVTILASVLCLAAQGHVTLDSMPVACREQVTVAGQAPSLLPQGKKFKLVWNDEFEGTSLDLSKWSYRTNFWGRRAHWFAAPEDGCVEVKDGVVKLKVKKLANGQFVSPQLQTGELMWDVPALENPKGFWYVGKRMKPKFQHRYGYYECRCRLQQLPGWWSAFWMQTEMQGAATDPALAGIEHDIMESFDPGEVIVSCYHYNGYGPDYKGFHIPAAYDEAPKFDGKLTLDLDKEAFHTFGLLWEPTGYSIYVDGRFRGRNAKDVSQVPEFLLISTECKWYRKNRMTGTADPALEAAAAGSDDFVVDYVRVYDIVDAPAAGIAADSTVPKTFTYGENGRFNYRWHEPARKVEGKKYPLVLLLHGAGERGTNNVSQLIWGGDPIFQWFRNKGEEFYFIAGQVPNGKRWVEVDWTAQSHAMPKEMSVSMTGLVTLLEDLFKSDLPIDRDRVYATGVSMGGYGTWDLISRRPEWFAAAMPICGGGDVAQAAKLRELPIWIHHGDADGAVPVWRSRAMYSALLQAGSASVRYTEYPGCGHASWGPAYGNAKTFDWMFAQRRPAAWRELPETGDSITLENLPASYELAFTATTPAGEKHAVVFHRGAGFPYVVVDGKVASESPFRFGPSKAGLTIRSLPNGERFVFSGLRIR